MRVDVRMGETEFHVSSWWAKSPDFVIDALRSQLKAAQTVWPELKDCALVKRKARTVTSSAPHVGA